MPTYEYEEKGRWRGTLPLIVLVGVLIGLLYIGPSSWTWRGLLAPALADVVFIGVFLGCGLLMTKVVNTSDSRLDWLFRMALGFVSGGSAGVIWSLIEDGGQSIVIAGLVGGGLGALMGLFEA